MDLLAAFLNKETIELALAIIGGVVTIASAVVKLTPSPKDNEVLAKVLAFLDYFSVIPKK